MAYGLRKLPLDRCAHTKLSDRVVAPRAVCDRRSLLLGVSCSTVLASSVSVAPDAAAWDGPAKLLKARQQANTAKLTAPVDLAIQRLQEAKALLATSAPTPADYDEALRIVRRASCNCYDFEVSASDSIDTRASLLTASLNLSDTCTFRIVTRNAAVLNADDDPVRVAAFATIDSLIRSYERLDGALLQAGEWDSETRELVAPALDKTISLQQDVRTKLLDIIASPVSLSRQ